MLFSSPIPLVVLEAPALAVARRMIPAISRTATAAAAIFFFGEFKMFLIYFNPPCLQIYFMALLYCVNIKARLKLVIFKNKNGPITGPLPKKSKSKVIFSELIYSCAGSVTVKTVPSSGWLSTVIWPPCICTISRTMASPSPAPASPLSSAVLAESTW